MPDAKPAATLILLREGSHGPELLMIQRAQGLRFAGGAMVFPGGKVDPVDAAIAADLRLADGFARLDPDDAQARVAALRETFEEADVLLSEGLPIDAATRAHWRRRIATPEVDFAAFLRHVGHRLRAEQLVPFAHWRPPIDLAHRRYDTRFYLAMMPEGETARHDGDEAVASHWIRPADALAQADTGLSTLIFPTRRNLERLAVHDRLDALIAAAQATPLRLIQPFIAQRDGRPHLCIPDGQGYPITAEALDTVVRG